MIQPTVGRVVLFNPNVGGFDANGVPFSSCSLKLLQDDDAIPDSGTAYACWMPYQIKTAASSI